MNGGSACVWTTLLCCALVAGCRGREGNAEGEGEVGRCGTAQVRCGETCASLRNNLDHCGFCGVACTLDESCVDGLCVAPCLSPSLPAEPETLLFESPRLDVVATGRAADGRILAILRDGGLLDASTTPPTMGPPGQFLNVRAVGDIDPAPGHEVVVFDPLRVLSLDGSVIVELGDLFGSFNDLDDDGVAELVTSDGIYASRGAGFELLTAFASRLSVRECVLRFDVDGNGTSELISLGSRSWFLLEDGVWEEHLWAGGNVSIECSTVVAVSEDDIEFIGPNAVATVFRRDGTLALQGRFPVRASSIDGARLVASDPDPPLTSWFINGVFEGYVVGVGVGDSVVGALPVVDRGRLWQRRLLVPNLLSISTGEHELTFPPSGLLVDGEAVARGSREIGFQSFAGLPVAQIDDNRVIVGVFDFFDRSVGFVTPDSTLSAASALILGNAPHPHVTLADVDGDGRLDALGAFPFAAPTTVYFADGRVEDFTGSLAACDFLGDGDAEFVRALDGSVERGTFDGGIFVPLEPLGAGTDSECRDLDADGDLDLQGVRNDDGILVVDDRFRGATDLDSDGILEAVTCDDAQVCVLADDDLRLTLPLGSVYESLRIGPQSLISHVRFRNVLRLRCSP